MNCFEWQNRASDYLDGTLMSSIKREADQHLDTCTTCSEHYRRYRLILNSLAVQPRVPLPIPMRKSPFAPALHRIEMARLGRSRWEQIPWYIRTTLEATSIVLLILLGISAGPKVRALYESKIEQNLSEFADSLSQSETSSESASYNLPLSRGKPGAPTSSEGTREVAETVAGGDDFESESDTVDEEDSITEGTGVSDEKEVRVGNSEIWRFNFKTDSPHEMRAKVVQVLSELKIPPNTPGLGGVEAPGGIQFDLMLPQSVVAPLKKHLQKLAPPAPEGASNSIGSETFTWYKNKAKNSVPTGQTHVVIWLSLM